MEELIIYTYTVDRLEEFKKEKKENEVVLSPLMVIENKDSFENDESKTYYFDITNLYKACNEKNPLSLELFLSQIPQYDNWKIIINYNLKNKFYADFGSYIKEFIPINKIHINENEFNGDFSTLSDKEILEITEGLNQLVGHEQFKEDFLKQIKEFNIYNKLDEVKIFSLLLCGDSGVGKTEFARIIHKTLFSNSKPIKINMGNYNTKGSLNSLIGSPKGYVGSERGGELSNKIKNSDSKIILIDEFEKADIDIFNFFYELLEDGKFTDLDENEFDLNGYLIVFTTNLKKDNYRDVIPNPLISRFTMKYVFEKLSFIEKNEYIEKRANNLINKYKEKIGEINITPKTITEMIGRDLIYKIDNLRDLNKLVREKFLECVEKTD